MAGLFEGIAQGGMMGMIGKRRKDARDSAAARKDQRNTLANLDSIDAGNKADLEAGDMGQPSPEERKEEHDLQLADGGEVGASQSDVRKADRIATKRMTGDERERLMLRENLPDKSGQSEYRMGHGQLDITSEQAMRGETPATIHFRDGDVKQIEDQGKRIQKGADKFDRYEHQYADGGMIGKRKGKAKMGSRVGVGPAEIGYADGGVVRTLENEQKKHGTLSNINRKPQPQSQRDGGKRPPVSPMIGVRADLGTDVPGGHNDPIAQAEIDNTVLMANGGTVGYSSGGILEGNFIPGGYNQHGSVSQTSDPMWYAPCVRDFGKKGPK